MDDGNLPPEDDQNDSYYDNVASNRTNNNRRRNRALALAVVGVAAHRLNSRRQTQPMHNSILTGSMRVEELLNGHEEIIQGMISMKAETFRSLKNVDVNADYVFSDGIDGTGPSTGSHQHDPSREAMNGMRDLIANEMWERYQVSPWYRQM
ncbi:hypothetical protein TIFTF001_053436 [Ficus carica]|uniref:Uncharacterized protein n=1 Tax=Ficus carica TaxID=3494 RepID=A0AA88ED29_FICCA|nr:hypothetical protein TIFTF001_053436 [Ficus carica]